MMNMTNLRILNTPQTKNRCYQNAQKITPVGILMHSTGAVNRDLKRYVDAPDLLGQNQYNNTWNNPNTDKCMHAFIGLDADKRVAVAETLPLEWACWGCGKGVKGSYNYDPTAHIQFEVCQGSDTDSTYYWDAMGMAAMYCAHLCKVLNLPVSSIVSHRQAAERGYASNHGDPDSWMKCFGDSMNAFRDRVAALLAGETVPGAEEGSYDPPPVVDMVSVRLDRQTAQALYDALGSLEWGVV